MKKVQLLCLAGMALAYAACSKDDDNNNNNDNGKPAAGQPELYLTGYVSDKYNDSSVIDYNSDKTPKRQAAFAGGLSGSVDISIDYLQYENGKLKQFNFADDDKDTEGQPSTSVTFNTAGQIIKTTDIRTVSRGGFTTYTYNAQGQLIEERAYNSSDMKDSVITTLTWENNNVVKAVIASINSYLGEPDTTVITYTYYDKANIFEHVRSLAYINEFVFYYHSANNLKDEQWLRNGVVSSLSTSEYSYDDKGYPTNIKMKNTYYAGDDVSHDEENLKLTFLLQE